MSEKKYDLVIIGGACAGLAAGIYAARRAMSTLIITKDIGGQIATTPTVENYPGIDFITGPDLAALTLEQALKWGAEMTYDEIHTVEKRGEKDFVITGNKGSYTGKSLLLAYGKTPKNLNVPGEKEYAGRGVSYCVTCDAPLYKGRTVVVVGGGNSGMEGALMLAKICEKVYLVHRSEKFRGEAVLEQQIRETPNIEVILNADTTEVVGDGRYVTGLSYTQKPDGTNHTLTVDGIFVEIGFIVNSGMVKELVELDRMNQVVTNKRMETNNPGVLAAGDITDSPYKQAVISAGEGAAAALSAYNYVNDGANPGVDWSGKH